MILTNETIAGFYLIAPVFTLDTEGEDQAKTPSMVPSGNKNQLSDEDIINITRLATLYLANMLYIDIEQQQPNNSAKHQSTNENFLEKIGQQRQKIHNMLNSYMTNNQTETQDLFDLNTPKYKETDLLQQEIQQQLLIIKKPQSTTADTKILKKQIKTLHIILKLLYEINPEGTTPSATTTLIKTIQQYQSILNNIFPLDKLLITQLIQESQRNQFEALFLTNAENKTIQQFSQSTTDLLLETFTQTLNTYMGNDKRTTIPISQLTKPIIDQLNPIIKHSTNYLGVESTILTLKNQLEAINKQLEVTETTNYDKIEEKLDHKNKLAKQAIDNITKFLQIMIQTADEGANQKEIKQIAAEYTQLGNLLQQQEAEKEQREKEEQDKKEEEDRLRREEAITTNLKSTTDKLSKIINILY